MLCSLMGGETAPRRGDGGTSLFVPPLNFDAISVTLSGKRGTSRGGGDAGPVCNGDAHGLSTEIQLMQ